MSETLPQDVVNLVIAAREISYGDMTPASFRALDLASEAFAARVPWDDDPTTRETDGAPIAAGKMPERMPLDLHAEIIDEVFGGAIKDAGWIWPIYRSIFRRYGETAEPGAQGITLATLQLAHVARQDEWCPDQKPDLSFRGNEMGGECGEAQNVIKKLERERLGWRGSRDTVEHLGEELADVIHSAILVAITAGIDIERAVIANFNKASEKHGLSTVINAAPALQSEGLVL